MSDADLPEADRLEGFPHPRETARLIGHPQAEAEVLQAVGSGRLHHAWLLTGPKGIGKATLAWRIATHLLATPADDGGGLFGDAPPAPETLDITPDHPVARRVMALSEPRLFLLRRPYDDKRERLKQDITVDETRKLKGFFALSAADGGRRVVIVDAADEMNTSAANALLKVLEEPPKDTTLLLISHQPSRLLPTIRSRCRVMRLSPLDIGDLGAAISAAEQEDIDPSELRTLWALSGGSVGAALQLRAAGGAQTYAGLLSLFADLPRLDRGAALKLADQGGARGREDMFHLIVDLTELFLSRVAHAGATGTIPEEAAAGEAALAQRLAPDPKAAQLWAEAQAALPRKARRSMALNLDPAALLLDMFHGIQDVASRIATRPAA